MFKVLREFMKNLMIMKSSDLLKKYTIIVHIFI